MTRPKHFRELFIDALTAIRDGLHAINCMLEARKPPTIAEVMASLPLQPLDHKHLKKMLNDYTEEEALDALIGYVAVWEDAATRSVEDGAHEVRAQNDGRREANLWLGSMLH